MSEFKPRLCQEVMHHFMMDRYLVQGAPGAGILAAPGLGKTAAVLVTHSALRGFGEIRRTLIVAPKRVVDTVWEQESIKWGFGISFSRMSGTPKQRLAAARADAEVYLLNPENLGWYLRAREENNLPEIDWLVGDESTLYRNWGRNRSKNMRALSAATARRAILTGTPIEKSLRELFPQIFLLDQGASLGKSQYYFDRTYCRKSGWQGREWTFNNRNQATLIKRIADQVIWMKEEDYLDLPPVLHTPVWVTLDKEHKKQYELLEAGLFSQMDLSESMADCSNAYSACRGFAAGGVYHYDVEEGEKKKRSNRISEIVHWAKVKALRELFDSLAGRPLLVATQYDRDLEMIRKEFGPVPAIKGGVDSATTNILLAQWDAGELPMLCVHPRSLSYGVNMQTGPGRDIAWFGMSESSIEIQQFNKRIHRAGVSGSVTCHYILCLDTVDEVVYERWVDKTKTQGNLFGSLQEYRVKKVGSKHG